MIKVTLVAPNVSGLGEEAVAALRTDIIAWVDQVMEDSVRRIQSALSRVGPSQPGQAPRRRTGEYHDSWEHAVRPLKRAIEGRLGSKLWRKFGTALEYGNDRIKPRPHVGPMLESWKRDLNADIDRASRGR